MIAAQPDASFLNFTLGNQYAAQGRWAEAQQAYFRAYSGDPEHPILPTISPSAWTRCIRPSRRWRLPARADAGEGTGFLRQNPGSKRLSQLAR